MNNKKYFSAQDLLIQLEQINYMDVLNILTPFIVGYITNKAIDTYTLHREYKPKNIKKVNMPPELKFEYNNLDIDKIANTKIKESLKKFAEILIEKFKKEDLINFYNNINTLKTSSSNFKLHNFILQSNNAGCYNIKNNKITVNENYFSTVIYHELLHMASSTSKNGIIYSGFDQSSLKPKVVQLGKGINEGYTELLNRRYFTETANGSNAYEYEVIIADRLEKIIGQEKMEKLYLNANLLGLIKELNQYSSEDKIMTFISNTDFILKHLDNKKLKLFENRMIAESLKNINKFLIKTYSKKLLLEYLQNNITNEQMTNQLIEYISSLGSEIQLGNRNYKISSDKDLIETLESVFGKSNVSFSTDTEEISSIKNK